MIEHIYFQVKSAIVPQHIHLLKCCLITPQQMQKLCAPRLFQISGSDENAAKNVLLKLKSRGLKLVLMDKFCLNSLLKLSYIVFYTYMYRLTFDLYNWYC